MGQCFTSRTGWLLLGGMMLAFVGALTSSALAEVVFQTQFPSGPVDERWEIDQGYFFSAGNSNWSRMTGSAQGRGTVLQMMVGESEHQDAIVGTRDPLPGIVALGREGIRYTFILGGRSWGRDAKNGRGDARLAVYTSAGSGELPGSLWRAENGFAFVFNDNWCALVVKQDKGMTHEYTRRLWSANYNGVITRAELLVTEHDYAIALTGLGGTWNISGVQAGRHGLPVESLGKTRMAIELFNRKPARTPFWLEVIGLQAESVP